VQQLRVATMAVLLILACSVSGQRTSAKSVAEAMVDTFEHSWNTANGQEYGTNYWPEAELVSPSGDVLEGRDAIVKRHMDLWSGMLKGSRITAHVRRVRPLGVQYLMVDFDVVVSGVREFPPGSPTYPDRTLRNHLKHILQERNGPVEGDRGPEYLHCTNFTLKSNAEFALLLAILWFEEHACHLKQNLALKKPIKLHQRPPGRFNCRTRGDADSLSLNHKIAASAGKEG